MHIVGLGLQHVKVCLSSDLLLYLVSIRIPLETV